MAKTKKHTFIRDEENQITVCLYCGYVYGQEEKRG